MLSFERETIYTKINDHILRILNELDDPSINHWWLSRRINELIELNNYNAKLNRIYQFKDKLVVEMVVENNEVEFLFPGFECFTGEVETKESKINKIVNEHKKFIGQKDRRILERKLDELFIRWSYYLIENDKLPNIQADVINLLQEDYKDYAIKYMNIEIVNMANAKDFESEHIYPTPEKAYKVYLTFIINDSDFSWLSPFKEKVGYSRILIGKEKENAITNK